MTAVAATPASLRRGIENALRQKIGRTPVSGTVEWLVVELGGPRKTVIGAGPLYADVQRALRQMQSEGRVTTRRLRSGETVWKLTDRHHKAWQALSNSFTSTRE